MASSKRAMQRTGTSGTAQHRSIHLCCNAGWMGRVSGSSWKACLLRCALVVRCGPDCRRTPLRPRPPSRPRPRRRRRTWSS
eukprot:8515262-Alexandrium_andersonii.AAC.1